MWIDAKMRIDTLADTLTLIALRCFTLLHRSILIALIVIKRLYVCISEATNVLHESTVVPTFVSSNVSYKYRLFRSTLTKTCPRDVEANWPGGFPLV